MSRFPVLVADFIGGDALVMGCNCCGHEERYADVDEFCEAREVASCPACGSHDFVAAYEQGVACANCGRMDFQQPVGGCCSRACSLQAEYARRLAGAR